MVDCAATWLTMRTLLCEKRFLGKLQVWHNQAQLWQRVAATSWSHTSRAKRCKYLASLSLLPKGFLCLARQTLQIGQWSCCYSGWCGPFPKRCHFTFQVWEAGMLARFGPLVWDCHWTHWWTTCWIRMQWNMTAPNVSKTLVPVLEIESPMTHSFTHGRMVCLTPAHVKK